MRWTAEYRQRLVEIVRRCPRSLDPSYSLWTLQQLADYQAEETGIRVTKVTVRQVLSEQGIVAIGWRLCHHCPTLCSANGRGNVLINEVLPAPGADHNGAPLPTAGLGVQVYLRQGDFIPMQEGDWVLVRGGVVKSFRGEMEIEITEPGQIWPFAPGTPLSPLPVTISAISETLEGRLVSFTGTVSGWQGDSIFLGDPTNPDAQPIRVTVRASLGWRRPYVQKDEQFQVIGIVSQFASATPWNDGYRVLVRYESDLVRVSTP